MRKLSASLTEVSSKTNFNALNAEKASTYAENAKTNAVAGNEQMKEMLKAMDEINISSTNINTVIKVIDEIAFQTNILALNAAVEAARAGQYGKGFAVVAEEVRTLASKSANAVKETTEMINKSILRVESGTKIAQETADALQVIVEEISKASSLVKSIADSSNDQAKDIGMINHGINVVSQVTSSNSATSEESAAASEKLARQAAQLRELAGVFKLKDTYADENLASEEPETAAAC